MKLVWREQAVRLLLQKVQNWTKHVNGDESQPVVTSGRGGTGTGQEGPLGRGAEVGVGSGSHAQDCRYLRAAFFVFVFVFLRYSFC